MRPGAPEIIVIAVVAILLFGATKLPVFARSLGQSMRIFKAEVKGMQHDDNVAPAPGNGLHGSTAASELPTDGYAASPAQAVAAPAVQPIAPITQPIVHQHTEAVPAAEATDRH